MKRRLLLLGILVLLIAAVGWASVRAYSRNHPTDPFQSPLLGYLSERQFKSVLIGRWATVWTHPGAMNVTYLELHRGGKARLIMGGETGKGDYTGTYIVSFTRPPVPGSTTSADIEIGIASNRSIVLQRVHFGLHNGVSGGPFLRTRGAPWATMKRVG